MFELPEPAVQGGRATVKLNGMWEVCRHDEQLPGEVAQPIKGFPEEPHWKAIAVPGDKNTLRPDLLFAHRLWYRTRVDVPGRIARSPIVPPGLPAKQPQHDGVRQRGLLRLQQEPVRAFQIDMTKGSQARQSTRSGSASGTPGTAIRRTRRIR